MTSTLSSADLHASGLVRLLTSLMGQAAPSPPLALTERLGRLLDMNGSLKLSQIHARLSRLSFESDPALARSLEKTYMATRATMEQSIHDSFREGERTGFQFRLPELAPKAPMDRCPAYDPYLRFYQAHQREFSFRLQALQADTRQAAAGVSLKLTQVAVLDRVLGEFMQSLTQRSLSQIPKLLGLRFKHLFDTLSQSADCDSDLSHARWLAADGWLTQFHNEMKSTLLLELDLRMQPILGLIEAINEHTQSL